MNKLGNKAWETRLPASMLCPSFNGVMKCCQLWQDFSSPLAQQKITGKLTTLWFKLKRQTPGMINLFIIF